MKMLNIGCGGTHHADWINLDLQPSSPEVAACDLTRGLPFPAGSVDCCYSSHVLEHLRTKEAHFFIEEQRRVLKPSGIIRVVVPDLEVICRNYLRYLDEVTAGQDKSEFKYDYSLLELYDQTTRERPGGELWRAWTSVTDPEDLKFVVLRHGKTAEDAITQYRRRLDAAGGAPGSGMTGRSARRFWSHFTSRRRVTELLVRILLGHGGLASFKEGLFRSSGEIHRVMYDRYSLARLLALHGFVDIKSCGANESRISDFTQYGLDTFGGMLRKPDSLFMEATRG